MLNDEAFHLATTFHPFKKAFTDQLSKFSLNHNQFHSFKNFTKLFNSPKNRHFSKFPAFSLVSRKGQQGEKPYAYGLKFRQNTKNIHHKRWNFTLAAIPLI